MTDLPPFPTDDVTLLAVEHALNYSLIINEDGNPASSGKADYSFYELMDFLAKVGPDPEDGFQTYSHSDVIRALIAEVLILRGQLPQETCCGGPEDVGPDRLEL